MYSRSVFRYSVGANHSGGVPGTPVHFGPPNAIFRGFFSLVLVVYLVNKGAEVLTRLLFVLFVFCAVLSESSNAQESWGAGLFKTKRHDFGRVALGADAEFRFELTNTYQNDLILQSVRSSCTCTSGKLSASLLKPGETGAVIARLNTTGQHLRDKSAVLTVRLETVINGSRRIESVQLFVSGFIRPDTVLTPGSVEFGTVTEGMSATRVVQLEYTGRAGWTLTKVERSQPFIYAKAEEIRRKRGKGVYRITATLTDDAPVGYIRDVLRFTTNESQPGRSEPVEIVVPIQGVVTPAFRTKPSTMLMGVLVPGETATKNIVVRSITPFRITNVSASDPRFRFAFAAREGMVQLITVSFSAKQISPEQTLDIAETIHISTSDPQQKNVSVNAVVRIYNETP